mmetsp:Transcript_49654/g.100936  ORF Transcript_49654/g.100936 Transcript_49654/m.100936 type:complete len:217 (+) Transcript_49654:451-1101(+)
MFCPMRPMVSESMHMIWWGLTPAASRSFWFSFWHSMQYTGTPGTKRLNASTRSTFFVSSRLHLSHTMKHATAWLAHTRSRSRSVNTSPLKYRTLFLKMGSRWSHSRLSTSYVLSTSTTTLRLSRDSPWSGWNSSCNNSFSVCSDRSPHTRMNWSLELWMYLPVPVFSPSISSMRSVVCTVNMRIPTTIMMITVMRPNTVPADMSPYPTVEIVTMIK